MQWQVLHSPIHRLVTVCSKDIWLKTRSKSSTAVFNLHLSSYPVFNHVEDKFIHCSSSNRTDSGGLNQLEAYT